MDITLHPHQIKLVFKISGQEPLDSIQLLHALNFLNMWSNIQKESGSQGRRSQIGLVYEL